MRKILFMLLVVAMTMVGCKKADTNNELKPFDPNIRIDTHRDNTIMQHNIAKHGFTYCGIIYLASGDERLAYQKII